MQGLAKSHFRTISQAVNEGHTMTQALAATGDYFPLLMRELTAVGEESGKLDAVYKQLAEHFQQRLQMRRMFLAAIAWPMIQLAAAVAVIVLLIVILGVIRDMNPGVNIDILGFGLYGTRGLTIYFAFIGAVGAAIWLVLLPSAVGWPGRGWSSISYSAFRISAKPSRNYALPDSCGRSILRSNRAWPSAAPCG